MRALLRLFLLGILLLMLWRMVGVGALTPDRFALAAVMLGDSLAYAFTRVGVRDPAVAWALLGVVGGGLVGAIVGLRRGGRAVPRRPVVALGVAAAVALFAVGNPASGVAAVASDADSAFMVPENAARVFAAELSVRARPARGARTVGTVVRGEQVVVVGRTADGGWYQIDGIVGGRRLTGWVSSRYVARPGGSIDVTDGRTTPVRDTGALGGEVALPQSPSVPQQVTSGNASTDTTADAADGPGDNGSGAQVVAPAAPAPGAPSTTPNTAPSRPAGGHQPIRAGGFNPAPPAEAADPQVVADIDENLRAARTAAGKGDFALALRELAAGDEWVTIAAGRHGETAWVGELRHQVKATRSNIRTTCERAAAAAVGRGEPPPRCE